MTSSFYELIGRSVVRLVWMSYGREIRIAAGLGVAAAVIGGYLLARREPPEG